MACRDMDRGHKAAEEVRKRSGNGNVIVKQLDLASLQSVRHLANDIVATEERLDVLINNAGKLVKDTLQHVVHQHLSEEVLTILYLGLAGIMSCPQWKTADGFEMQFGVNHLGHFLLTNCLLDLLKKSTPSRIVIVSSLAHQKGTVVQQFSFIHFYMYLHEIKCFSNVILIGRQNPF